MNKKSDRFRKPRKLFLSFDRTMRGLIDGKITAEDLANGLFYLIWSRASFISLLEISSEYGSYGYPQNICNLIPDNIQRSKDDSIAYFNAHIKPNYALLRDAIRKAEKEGRCKWPKRGYYNPFSNLTKLLLYRGFGRIEFVYDEGYRGVGSKIIQNATGLEVIYPD